MSEDIIKYLDFATSVLTLLVVIWQSILSDHFSSSCWGGKICAVDNDLVMKNKNPTPATLQQINLTEEE